MVSGAFVCWLAPKLSWSIGRTIWSYHSTRVDLCSHQILLIKCCEKVDNKLVNDSFNTCFQCASLSWKFGPVKLYRELRPFQCKDNFSWHMGSYFKNSENSYIEKHHFNDPQFDKLVPIFVGTEDIFSGYCWLLCWYTDKLWIWPDW